MTTATMMDKRAGVPFSWSVSGGIEAMGTLAGVRFDLLFRDLDAIVLAYTKGGAAAREMFGPEIQKLLAVLPGQERIQLLPASITINGPVKDPAVGINLDDAKKLIALIPGTIIDLFVKNGSKVSKDDKLLLLEAMKMKNEILAPMDGVIKKVHVKKGQKVPKQTILIEMK